MARSASNRAPAGTLHGGRFVARQHAESDVVLIPGQMDIWECIAEAEADEQGRDEDATNRTSNPGAAA